MASSGDGARRPRFELAVIARLLAILVALALVAWLVGATRYRVVPLLILAIAAAQTAELFRYIASLNRGVARALAAWRSGDFADSAVRVDGAGFAQLASDLADTGARLRERQRQSEQQARYLGALVSHAPVPLLSIDGARVELLNLAARRLFGTSAVATLDDLAGFGPGFARCVLDTPPGERRLARIVVDGVAQHLLVAPSYFTADGTTHRLVSLQGIQSELDARTIEAWLDMSRVLAHEIMSSLTPVVSLTATAAELLGGESSSVSGAALADAREAIDTVARRSEGLMAFVRRYREVAALPPPDRQPVAVDALLRGVATLLRADLASSGVTLHEDVVTGAAPLRADRALLEQALINLVRNAADAVRGRPDPAIWLTARHTRTGRIALEVADNGPGVPADLLDTIFVPFFTTKRAGSGVGLSIAQHVAHAHGGTITVTDRPGGGAAFAIVL